MKKIILALLALALSISLCACGGNTDTDGSETTDSTKQSSTETTDTTETTESTSQTESEEEKQLKATKARYEKANEYLAEYLEDGEFRNDDTRVWYEDNAALEYLYKEFEACGDYEDSAEILSRFTVLPDMLTSIGIKQTDNLGNISEYTYKTYEYDEKGTSQDDPILELLGISGYADDFEYAYDDTDRIISVKLVDDGTVEAIVTPEYDANGNVVKATIQTNNGTYTSTYDYDEQNHLIAADKYRVDWRTVWTLYSYTYSYDADGNLAEEKYSYTDIRGTYNCTVIYDQNGDLIKKFEASSVYEYEYEYDANGYLVMMKETYTETPLFGDGRRQTITQFLNTNDENGRPISAELIETVDGKNSYASQILTYNYETLYFYNAE